MDWSPYRAFEIRKNAIKNRGCRLKTNLQRQPPVMFDFCMGQLKPYRYRQKDRRIAGRTSADSSDPADSNRTCRTYRAAHRPDALRRSPGRNSPGSQRHRNTSIRRRLQVSACRMRCRTYPYCHPGRRRRSKPLPEQVVVFRRPCRTCPYCRLDRRRRSIPQPQEPLAASVAAFAVAAVPWRRDWLHLHRPCFRPCPCP